MEFKVIDVFSPEFILPVSVSSSKQLTKIAKLLLQDLTSLIVVFAPSFDDIRELRIIISLVVGLDKFFLD